MIIGVDAGCLGATDNRLKAGVYYVTLHLLRELSRIDIKNKYILYSFNPIPKDIMRQFSPHWENKVLQSKGWLYLSLPLSFLKQKPDVFLALSQAMPWYHPYKTIGFIHGLDFLPEFHAERNKKLKINSEYLITHADILITTSQFLKKSLEKYHKKNIVVSSLGIDSVFFGKTKPYLSSKPYFLFVGTLKPSKNIPNILKAFSLYLKKTKKEYNFLFIGSNFWLDKEISATIDKLNLKDSLKFIPFVENKELVGYYKSATAFVSPSLYEGFGLPFVESMAAGCPVIGSTVGAIPEIVRDAGLLYEPSDYKSIADAIVRVSEDSSLRRKLIVKGKERAKQFMWEGFAKDVLQGINTV